MSFVDWIKNRLGKKTPPAPVRPTRRDDPIRIAHRPWLRENDESVPSWQGYAQPPAPRLIDGFGDDQQQLVEDLSRVFDDLTVATELVNQQLAAEQEAADNRPVLPSGAVDPTWTASPPAPEPQVASESSYTPPEPSSSPEPTSSYESPSPAGGDY